METQLLVRGLTAIAIVDPELVVVKPGHALVDYPPTVPLGEMTEGFVQVLLEEGVEAAAAYQPRTIYPQEISMWRFRTRFTFEERVGFEGAVGTDPVVATLMKDLEAVKDKMVDLALPETQLGLHLLVSKGLITQARADYVLHYGDGTPPDPEAV